MEQGFAIHVKKTDFVACSDFIFSGSYMVLQAVLNFVRVACSVDISHKDQQEHGWMRLNLQCPFHK